MWNSISIASYWWSFSQITDRKVYTYTRERIRAGINNEEIYKVSCVSISPVLPRWHLSNNALISLPIPRSFWQVSPRRITWSHLRSPDVSPWQRFTMTTAFQRSRRSKVGREHQKCETSMKLWRSSRHQIKLVYILHATLIDTSVISTWSDKIQHDRTQIGNYASYLRAYYLITTERKRGRVKIKSTRLNFILTQWELYIIFFIKLLFLKIYNFLV